MRPRSAKSIELGNTIMASVCSAAIVENARSNSSGPCTATNRTCSPRVSPAASASFIMSLRSPYAPGCQRATTWEAEGSASLSKPKRLGTSCGLRRVSPVIFPPGRARLATSPSATGSPIFRTTIGIVVVACCAARPASEFPATMTSKGPCEPLCSAPFGISKNSDRASRRIETSPSSARLPPSPCPNRPPAGCGRGSGSLVELVRAVVDRSAEAPC